ncbi:hypothetical protein [Conexibacter arvalis]|uniref:Uncharacterized protein n=1 Tax=Conexibacter arvalis TaxID=912552 RepID=A0A840IAV4_9ACTN|nr:hypothetical protein [Conexibacter arvalis]MBB4661208.1 hypothetical protein [Conexibacter arvalis]
MHASDLCFPSYNAAARHTQIRWTLLVHGEIREVLQTPQADTLRVLHRGDAAPEAWARTLVEAGFPAPRVEPPGAAWRQRRERAS